ncbi:transcriptional regulator [Thermococcus peptonophilus]|uniref:Transcriptional regulator n=1 Tax=Thermococcus peptonophilus TaxID=53952 RepID=A0A142CTB1_9EURY|nr:winged helix-turn-helix domain-containing protein [Thermococcus peptonophilus]AMQ18013.1 transcriptional regulator [Thermococcus peptonophilus]
MNYEVIDIHDERAKELAQILSNEKALSILKLIEERPRSISEISQELEIPISTVSYHIDRMLKVGLVEVAGRKYGKRLQEVKLYRASSKPILILPGGKKKHRTWEKLRVINLAVSAVASTGVYFAVKLLTGRNGEQSETVRILAVNTAQEASKTSIDWAAVLIAVLTFMLIFGVLEHRFRKRF